MQLYSAVGISTIDSKKGLPKQTNPSKKIYIFDTVSYSKGFKRIEAINKIMGSVLIPKKH